MLRTIANQAEAEEERLSKVISSEREFHLHNIWRMKRKF
jgi:hypothetical protein